MGKEYDEIDGRIRNWIDRQHLFFISTAPRADDGRINCSPKGLDSLRVLGPRQMACADTGGERLSVDEDRVDEDRVDEDRVDEDPPSDFRGSAR